MEIEFFLFFYFLQQHFSHFTVKFVKKKKKIDDFKVGKRTTVSAAMLCLAVDCVHDVMNEVGMTVQQRYIIITSRADTFLLYVKVFFFFKPQPFFCMAPV